VTPHWKQTRAAMRNHRFALIVHDTTILDFSNHRALEGIGPVGDGGGRGFLQHHSLVVIPQPRQVVGLVYQQLYVRQPAPAGERSAQRKQRQRESELWLKGIAASGPAPEGRCWGDVADRGADIDEAMLESQKLQHQFLFRATQNRRVFATAEQDQEARLFEYVRTLPSLGNDEVDIPGRGGRPARTAHVQLACAPVWIPAPLETPKRRSQPVIAAWVVRVWEVDAPAGVEPLEWVLPCSLPTRTLQEAKERRDWYSCRWMAEVYHQIAKSGCGEEKRRFETAEAMRVWLAILSVVAVRVFQLRCALESQPNAPATQVASAARLAACCHGGSHGLTDRGIRASTFPRPPNTTTTMLRAEPAMAAYGPSAADPCSLVPPRATLAGRRCRFPRAQAQWHPQSPPRSDHQWQQGHTRPADGPNAPPRKERQ
jgi:hypothetical protein